MRKRIGFGENAFKTINVITKRPAKRKDDVFDYQDSIIYFDSEEHLNILIG